jgi:hypothetical protein
MGRDIGLKRRRQAGERAGKVPVDQWALNSIPLVSVVGEETKIAVEGLFSGKMGGAEGG